MSKAELLIEAKRRYQQAERAFRADCSGWVSLLAMQMCLAAIDGKEQQTDLEKLARAAGMIP